MDKDGIDVLERLEKLEKGMIKLSKKVAKLQNDIMRSYEDKSEIKFNANKIYTSSSNNVCYHNYPRLESTGGKTCSNCGKVMEALFAPRETTGIRMHL